MRIETDSGDVFDARLVTELTRDGSLLVQLNDTGSRLSVLADVFESAEEIRCDDGRICAGYTDLRSVSRLDGECVQLRLYKTREV